MSEQKCPVKRGYTVIQAVFILLGVVCLIIGAKQLIYYSDSSLAYAQYDERLYYSNVITSAVSLFFASIICFVFAILAYVKKKEFEKKTEISNKQLEELSEIKKSLQKLCEDTEAKQERDNEKDTWICKSCGEIIKLNKRENPANCPVCKGIEFIHR